MDVAPKGSYMAECLESSVDEKLCRLAARKQYGKSTFSPGTYVYGSFWGTPDKEDPPGQVSGVPHRHKLPGLQVGPEGCDGLGFRA